MADSVGIPTVSGVKGAFGDFAWGSVAGLAFVIVSALFGSNLLGLILAPVVSGSILKGERGTVVATVAGFLAAAALLGGSGESASASSSAGVM